jgi:hypothetical protein
MNPDQITDIVYWEMEPGEKPAWFGRPEILPYIGATTRLGWVLMGVPFVVVGSVLIPVAIPFGVLFGATGFFWLGCRFGTILKQGIRSTSSPTEGLL